MEKFTIEKRPEREKKKEIIVEIGCGRSPFFLKAGRKIEKNEQYIGVDLFPATGQPLEEWLDPDETIRKLSESDLVKGRADLVSASGDNLPLENGSVKEIIFKDVFGSPFIDSISFAKKDILDNRDESQIAFGKKLLIEEIDKRIWPKDKKDYYKNEIRTKKYAELDERLKRLIRHYYYVDLQRQRGQEDYDLKPEFVEETFRILKKEGKMTIIETRTPDIALQYIQQLKNDGRFMEIPNIYKLENFVNSYTQENKLNAIVTFQKK